MNKCATCSWSRYIEDSTGKVIFRCLVKDIPGACFSYLDKDEI